MADTANISFRSVVPTSAKRGVANVYSDYDEWPNLDKYAWFVQAPVRQSGAFKAYVEMWKESVAQPYKGVTIDGNIREGLHKLEDEGAPVQEATTAAQ
ncbi:MAG: hypothetical protein CYPHOPRED_003498 [Cyphobasidiales sp. Tagirdzhanova-0007]|nr:MAG: hypothetical protein CYPHOPRED_003498 [Cyphobasidiales sp. Tagirdzhanova-0007]